jgi:hypothetical protein
MNETDYLADERKLALDVKNRILALKKEKGYIVNFVTQSRISYVFPGSWKLIISIFDTDTWAELEKKVSECEKAGLVTMRQLQASPGGIIDRIIN